METAGTTGPTENGLDVAVADVKTLRSVTTIVAVHVPVSVGVKVRVEVVEAFVTDDGESVNSWPFLVTVQV